MRFRIHNTYQIVLSFSGCKQFHKKLVTPVFVRLICSLVIKCSEAREHSTVSAAAQPHYLPGRSPGCGSVQDPCQVGYEINGVLSSGPYGGNLSPWTN